MSENADEERRASAQDLGRILRAIPEMVIVVDLEERIRYLNRAEPGYEPDDFVGQAAYDLMPAESQQVFREAVLELLESKEPQEFEVKIALTDGWEGWFWARVSEFGAFEGSDRILVVGRNVTALKEAEEDAARLRRLLPVCAGCDRIRGDEGTWEKIETYLAKKEGTLVSHGICPVCTARELDRDG